MGQYRRAQICNNGHLITMSADTSPELRAPCCSKCGASTIEACPSCNAMLRGSFYVPGIIGWCDYDLPLHCHECGAPYPWTSKSIQRASELIKDSSDVDAATQDGLIELLPDLISETPATPLAQTRLKKFVAAAGRTAGDALIKILVSVSSEVIKKEIGL